MSGKGRGNKKKNAGGKNPKKVREKLVEDKTFGMKNKKGKRAQQVRAQVSNQGISKQMQQKEKEADQRREAKKAEKARLEEERKMLGKVVQKPQYCPPGRDPKTILCMYFKRGRCENGKNCKFSHDKRIESQKKKNIFEDEDASSNMSEWDEATLRKAVDSVSKSSKANPTAKICNHFIKAIEDQKFGWNWVCPRGANCIYRHVLPKGYVLKKKKEEKVEERPLEEILEEERAKIKGGTPVNPESFAKWKLKIKEQEAKEEEEKMTKREKALAIGSAKLTGKELLMNADASSYDDGVVDDDDLLALRKQRRMEEDEFDKENARYADELNAVYADVEVDDPNVPKKPKGEASKKFESATQKDGKEVEEKNKVEVNESLFGEDEDEDLPEFSDDEDD